MILGIGTDIAHIKRFQEQLDTLGSKLVNKHFSLKEQETFKNLSKTQRASYMAKRFSAKESVAKALGTGIRDAIYLKDIEILNNDKGAPFVTLYDGALKQLAKITPKGYHSNINISISDDGSYAQTFVTIDAVKDTI